ncbi:MAG: four-carbon acid sugar kinase family protein, partial [Spirochaetales bacterium]|nr:four-carbon acid sugar kinase family protein [Spirochaetales bacterium]
FTGSNDSALELAHRGLPTTIGFASPKGTRNSFVLDTESRNREGGEAYRMTRDLIEDLDIDSYDIVLKKIDSTLRGNILEEIRAIDEKMESDLILVAPAFIQMGRTCRGGTVFVDSVKLLDTEFAHDPLKPVTEDNLLTLFSSEYPTVHLPVEDIRNKRFPQLGEKRVVVCDAEEEADLLATVTWAGSLGGRILYVGSAGLAGALIRYDRPKQPSLAIIASLSKASRTQLEYAGSRGVAILALDVLSILKGGDFAPIIDQGVHILKGGEDLVLTLTSALDRSVFRQSIEVGKALGLADGAVGALIKDRLSEISLEIIGKSGVRNLLLSGGETAYGLMRLLGIEEVEIIGEVDIGIPITLVPEGPHQGMRIVTKAGGFGKEDALTYGLRRLEEGQP